VDVRCAGQWPKKLAVGGCGGERGKTWANVSLVVRAAGASAGAGGGEECRSSGSVGVDTTALNWLGEAKKAIRYNERGVKAYNEGGNAGKTTDGVQRGRLAVSSK
jgi:hypothetical protein